MSEHGNPWSTFEREIPDLAGETFILLHGTLMKEGEVEGGGEIIVYARGSYYCVPAEARLEYSKEEDRLHPERRPRATIKLKPDAVIFQIRVLTARISSPSAEAEEDPSMEPCPWDGSEPGSVQCLAVLQGGRVYPPNFKC